MFLGADDDDEVMTVNNEAPYRFVTYKKGSIESWFCL